jgi:glycosyltransferase involved in cell wall biosynthesis
MISVVIPAYNSAAFLPETLHSILSQSFKDIEVIVVDDCSTDGTAGVVAGLGQNVRCIRLEKNSGGPARPRNIGIQAARGQWIGLFDADDLMLPGKLEEQHAFLADHPDIPLVFTNFQNFSDDGRYYPDFLRDHLEFQRMPKVRLDGNRYRIPSAVAFDTLIPDTYIGTPGVVMRRSLAAEVGGFDETLCNSDDVDFYFRVARRYDLGFIDRVLFKRRIHATNISSRAKAYDSRFRAYSKLKDLPLSAVARRDLNRMLSEILFSAGYRERLSGSRWSAVRYYLASLRYRKPDGRIIRSIMRVMMPFSLRKPRRDNLSTLSACCEKRVVQLRHDDEPMREVANPTSSTKERVPTG